MGHAAPTGRVRAELVKLTTRCDAQHLSRHCVAYVLDAQKSPHVEDFIEALDDIQRRLEGWHLGHLALDDVIEYVDDGHKVLRDSLRQHGVEPEMRFASERIPAR